MEKYKFSYGNKTNFFKVKFVKFCCVISCMFFYFWIWARMLGYADYLFRGNDIALKVTMAPIILSYGFLLIYLLIEALAPQMVYVYSEHIKIKRYGFNIRYIFNGFTDKIYLYDIVSCEKYYGARDEHFLYKKQICILIGMIWLKSDTENWEQRINIFISRLKMQMNLFIRLIVC